MSWEALRFPFDREIRILFPVGVFIQHNTYLAHPPTTTTTTAK